MGSKSTPELVQLAESTLTELQKVAGWQAGYSDKEKRVYFFNLKTQTTQWESPHTLAEQEEDDELGSSQPPSGQPPKYQQPKLSKFPAGQVKPDLPKADANTKDIASTSG